MNDQTLIENVEHYVGRGIEGLAAINQKQAKRLADPEAVLDWSEMRARMRAQARASIAADFRAVLVRVRADDPTAVDEHAAAIRRYLKQSLYWVRTPTSTDAVSNAMDGLVNDERLDIARTLGMFD